MQKYLHKHFIVRNQKTRASLKKEKKFSKKSLNQIFILIFIFLNKNDYLKKKVGFRKALPNR